MDKIVHSLFALLLAVAVFTVPIDSVGAAYLVIAYLVFAVIAFNQYDYHARGGISLLFSVQITLVFALSAMVALLVLGGLGSRTLELLIVLALTLGFVVLHDDVEAFVSSTSIYPYIAALGVLFGVFLHHSHALPADSGLGLFPVLAGIVLAFNLFVVPRYVDPDAACWSILLIALVVVLIGLPALARGEYTLWAFEVGTWSEDMTIPLLGRDVPVMRSIFANPNTLGLLAFPGTVAAAVATHRTAADGDHPTLAALPAGAFLIVSAGLVLSSSRASLLAAAIGVGMYALAAVDRDLLPVAVLGAVAGTGLLLGAIYLSVLPIDPGNRFALWGAGVEAIYNEGSLLGEGIVGTGDVIEPYLDDGGGAVHNSYLSIFIRAGLLGGVAYVVLAVGPIVHGLLARDQVNAPMVALATGFAVHQLFESYTLYQFSPGSVLGALAVGYVIASLAPDDGLPRTGPTPRDAPDDPDPKSGAYRADGPGSDDRG